MRKIVHIDMDAFYASVEQRDRPELRGKPVIVGGSPEGRGVVAACSYEARKFKVRSAMSSAKAIRLCPHAIFVPPRFSAYREASQKLLKILHEATDAVEPLALDEAYLDVTQNKLAEPSATKIAMYLKARIKGQLGLTASAGVAPNKFLAKLASEMRKPDGLFVIPPDKVEEVVRDLEVEKLWGIGPATAQKLHARGWNTTADLRRLTPEALVAVLGKFGRFVHGLAHGEDNRPVSAERKAKSRGAETTFSEDVLNIETLCRTLGELTERVARDLTKKNRAARQVCLKLRYADFTTVTRSKTLALPTEDRALLYETASALLRSSTDAGRIPVRLIGISVSGFDAPQEPDQLSLPIG